MSTTEIAELRRTIGQLRQCVGTLRARYGEASAVRRLANDVERLDIDAVISLRGKKKSLARMNRTAGCSWGRASGSRRCTRAMRGLWVGHP